jgi:CRISPR/Cas system-associated exonuclease Cas4 (RecB family)
MKMESIIKHYFDRYREKDQLPPIIEGEVRGKLPKGMPKTLYYTNDNGSVLMGRPDEYLELEDGAVVPFDHKTKSKAPESVHPAYQLQMDVYSYLLKMNGYKTQNKAYLAYYCPYDCDVHEGIGTDCKVIEVKTDLERTKKLLKKAEDILEGDIPEPSEGCEFCKWVDQCSQYEGATEDR